MSPYFALLTLEITIHTILLVIYSFHSFLLILCIDFGFHLWLFAELKIDIYKYVNLLLAFMSSSESVLAFVLLVTDSIATQEIFHKLQNYDKVKECHMIYGDYDLILKIELTNLAEMTSFMMELRKEFQIKKSSTLIALAP